MYLGCFGEAVVACFYSHYLRFETVRQLAQGPPFIPGSAIYDRHVTVSDDLWDLAEIKI